MKNIYRSLKPGGECLFLENMRGCWVHDQIWGRVGAGKNDWHYPTLEEFHLLSKPFDRVTYQTFGFLGFSRFPFKKTRYKLDIYLEKIFSPSWFYIYAGIYQK